MTTSRSERSGPRDVWKLTDEDWRNRKRRRAYLEALDDTLERIDHDLGECLPGDGRR